MYLLLDKESRCLCNNGTFGSTDISERGGLTLLKNPSWAYERSRRLLASGIATHVIKLPPGISVEADGSVYLTYVKSASEEGYDDRCSVGL